jgi:hypothetical protein
MKEWKKKYYLAAFIFLEVTLFFIFFSFIVTDYGVFASFGEGNVTVRTNLTVGNVFPEILNVSLQNGDSTFTLIPNNSKTIYCFAHVVDYNGEDDIGYVNATFFDNNTNFAAPDDNNSKYTNYSCVIDKAYGDEYTVGVNCSFDVWYYANASVWNCSVTANDSYNWKHSNSDNITISPLLALGLPDIIQYGTVNATYVSDENVTNVTNLGNVAVNLSLNGYAWTPGDGNAMNCTLGAIKNISIEHEKYNLTASTPGDLVLSQMIGNYTNLTTNPVIKEFSLDFRHNENVNEAWNYTYWRVYVPLGVAGTCQGNIIFAGTQSDGS